MHRSSVSSSQTGARSHRSRITTASELATKPEFDDWARELKLEKHIERNLTDTPIFSAIKTIQSHSKIFPPWVRDKRSNNYSFIPPAYQKWKDVLCSSLQADDEYTFVDGGEADSAFPFAIGIIVQLCHHQDRLASVNRTSLDSNTDIHFILDSLMMHSCDGDGDEFLVYSTEQKLRLPATSSTKANVVTTTADGVSSLDIIEFDPYTIHIDYRESMSAFSTKNPTLHLILVHCVVEYKRLGVGENQMKMGMVSALYQKKVLGIHNQFVFGIFQFNKDGLQVVAGIWEADTIKLYNVGKYSLRHPGSLVELYLVLRGMKRLAADYRKELLNSSKTLRGVFKTNPPVNEWATRDTNTIHELPEETDDEPQHGDSHFQRGLSTLELWDMAARINAFHESIRNCDPYSLWQVDP
ncbi:putative lactonase domain protein [Rhizoctonia solani 123E]|uniref:Putative lactonase domain protein n=1 Tax=Rhizoctonia solani 123E TaxID=1423351 RepID=A0A074RZP1_9AGAM|nr:putative lactonase domain protein [Rhizoctonia solani 123E]